jgi:competence protein ComEC
MTPPKPVLVLTATLVLFLSVATSTRAQHPARVHYIDVGQAESILLEFDKAAILIDAGGEQTNDAQQRDHLINYLTAFFNGRPDLQKTIDTIIISHPHIDHTMMLPAVMQTFAVRNLVDGGENKGSGIVPLRGARTWIKAHGGHYFTVTLADSKKPNFSNPALAAIQASEPNLFFKVMGGAAGCTNANNDSIVVAMVYHGKRFIFTGDAEDEADQTCRTGEIQALIQLYGRTNSLNTDVYKVDHHASRNGTDSDWLNMLSPAIAVISAGKNDPAHRVPNVFHAFQFGHPSEDAIKLIEAVPSMGPRTDKVVSTGNGANKIIPNRHITKAIYCTCWDGDIVIDAATLHVQTAVH